jgi:hypothetical protein
MSTATLYAVSHVTGSASSPNNALGAPDNVWTADGNQNNSWTSRWRLDAVAGSFQPSGTQTITLRVRKGTNSGNPSISSVTLWQGGTQIATISGGAVTVSSTAGVDETFTFDGALLTGFTDVDIQVAVSAAGGGPTARNSVELDAITWDAAYSSIVDVSFALTESVDTAAFSGILLSDVILAASESSDTFTADFSSIPLSDVILAATEAMDTFVGDVERPPEPAFDPFSFSSEGFYVPGTLLSIDLAATEGIDVAAASAVVFTPLTLAATESPDTATVGATVFTPLTLAATEAPDVSALSAEVRTDVSLAATESPDTAAVGATVFTPLALAVTESPDTASVGTVVYWPSTLAATESPDTASGSAEVRTDVSLATTEALDTAALDADVSGGLTLAATETRDTLAADTSVYWPADLAATEAQDSFAGQMVRVTILDAGAGAFTLQGNPASLKAARSINAESGQYSIAAPDAVLAYFRVLTAGSTSYDLIGHTARLYRSTFFYNDTEIVFVPPEVQHIIVAPESRADDVITVSAEVQHLTLAFEDRLIPVPADLDAERLPEYRDIETEPRLRAV